jgi:hypothetical protein
MDTARPSAATKTHSFKIADSAADGRTSLQRAKKLNISRTNKTKPGFSYPRLSVFIRG